LQHHLFTLTFDGKLHVAPIEELKGGIHNVLDIGTGTGIWAIDFGTESLLQTSTLEKLTLAEQLLLTHLHAWLVQI